MNFNVNRVKIFVTVPIDYAGNVLKLYCPLKIINNNNNINKECGFGKKYKSCCGK